MLSIPEKGFAFVDFSDMKPCVLLKQLTIKNDRVFS
jgi:hypothetical protein